MLNLNVQMKTCKWCRNVFSDEKQKTHCVHVVLHMPSQWLVTMSDPHGTNGHCI